MPLIFSTKQYHACTWKKRVWTPGAHARRGLWKLTSRSAFRGPKLSRCSSCQHYCRHCAGACDLVLSLDCFSKHSARGQAILVCYSTRSLQVSHRCFVTTMIQVFAGMMLKMDSTRVVQLLHLSTRAPSLHPEVRVCFLVSGPGCRGLVRHLFQAVDQH